MKWSLNLVKKMVEPDSGLQTILNLLKFKFDEFNKKLKVLIKLIISHFYPKNYTIYTS